MLTLPLVRASLGVLPTSSAAPDAERNVLDRHGRTLHDLRISVTDRCNFRCTYCMPRAIFGKDYPFLAADRLLTFDEIERVARAFVALGVRKVRLTGGEPLLRRDLYRLIERLAAIPDVDDLTLTTNGSLLAREAVRLKSAGLHRVTVSLDALDETIFRRMNDVGFPAARVLEGIAAAREAGLGPVKVNAVVRAGVNESEILPLARHFHRTDTILRFIEYMDVGTTNGWRRDDLIPADIIHDRIDAEMPLEALPPNYPGEVATRYRYRDGGGEIGIISSVSHPFCGDCSRVRLSADGHVYTCLFASRGHDLMPLLRPDAGTVDGDQVRSHLAAIWRSRADRYSEERGKKRRSGPKVEMSHIGG